MACGLCHVYGHEIARLNDLVAKLRKDVVKQRYITVISVLRAQVDEDEMHWKDIVDSAEATWNEEEEERYEREGHGKRDSGNGEGVGQDITECAQLGEGRTVTLGREGL